MNKLSLKNHSIKSQDLVVYALAMTVFSLLVTWVIELVANELFRLALI